MKTTITAKKTSIKDSFKERIDKKLSKFDRFFDDTAAANVVVRTEGGRETVEVTINNRGMIYRAEKTTAVRQQHRGGNRPSLPGYRPGLAVR